MLHCPGCIKGSAAWMSMHSECHTITLAVPACYMEAFFLSTPDCESVPHPALPQYLITAMAVAVCRHGHILMMANCTGGEKHGYAILCMHLLLVAGLVVKVWWYDINCRY